MEIVLVLTNSCEDFSTTAHHLRNSFKDDLINEIIFIEL